MLVSYSTAAKPLTRMTPQQAYAEVARTGTLWQRQIDGDLDVALLRPPPGSEHISLRQVQIEGSLRSSAGGPDAALWIGDQSRLRSIDLSSTRWTAALSIENSTVLRAARFDDAQFGAQFVLHDTVFRGPVSFRRAHFDAPVQITLSVFRPDPPLKASVSFSDAHFAAPARFDRSMFASGVRFDVARFDGDASFLGLKAANRASWRNVIFAGDAEFRFCHLGKADFGDEEQLSVFMHLADFRGCTMASLNLDYVDARGDILLVNVRVAPDDLTLRQASLAGARSDFSGLKVAGKLDLQGTQITRLEMQWPELGAALLRSNPDSDVLRRIMRRLEELKKDEDAREVAGILRDRLISEQLARPHASLADNALLWVERIVWGAATGYGTKLGRIVGVALFCWALLTLPLAFARDVRISYLLDANRSRPLANPVGPDVLQPPPASGARRILQCGAYVFALMFTRPDSGLRLAEPVSAAFQGYLLFVRGIGLALLALMVLTLANVSPAIQAVIGKIAN